MRSILLLLASCSLLGIGFLGGRLSEDAPAHAGDADACPSGSVNGNVNGDTDLDLGDAIYLLNYLFVGGSAPCDNRVELESEATRLRADLEACKEELAECRGVTTLRWYKTCGEPVCRGYTGPHEGIPLCSEDIIGEECEVAGALCDPQDGCNALIVCASSDPKAGGCPISQRRLKREIRYLSKEEQDRVRKELLETKVAKWRYVWDEETSPERLGFIIDDSPGSPAVRPDGERVDLYGYISQAVVAIQSQQRQLDRLQREIEELRRPGPAEAQ